MNSETVLLARNRTFERLAWGLVAALAMIGSWCVVGYKVESNFDTSKLAEQMKLSSADSARFVYLLNEAREQAAEIRQRYPSQASIKIDALKVKLKQDFSQFMTDKQIAKFEQHCYEMKLKKATIML
ncbi:hypothetical protein [Echinimonas agarilytica]|uniref:Uncharacterized protein n=1 Tax=Echinimonas agarilytica TaxID=1215918 RepID=A0AA41W8K4_9GAMM|nr:hypothetical protein [Echinimonas agarilytica]MCM2680836.1 hypothetical protein [Echinimonas agarilytica]